MIASIGRVEEVRSLSDGGLRCRVGSAALAPGLERGDSVAVDGVCVTNVESDDRSFGFEVISRTRTRTVVGRYVAGSKVNLELALPVAGRLQGHFVQGHVDGVGRVLSLEPRLGGAELLVEIPAEVHALTVARGSIALNGVSLTVAALGERDEISVGLTRHTLGATNLGGLRTGDRLNVEGDVLAKYVARIGAGR